MTSSRPAHSRTSTGCPQPPDRLLAAGITPTSAVVRVDMEGAADGTSYTDFHTLLKRDGTWKVIAKVFHQYEG